jgi:hypothetical protein
MIAMNIRLAVASAIAAAALLTLGACAKQPEQHGEIDWAKAALARNPQLELVSADAAAGTVTVRETGNGTVHKLRLDELVAGLPPPKVAAAAAPTPAATGSPNDTAPAGGETPAAPAEPVRQTTESVAAAQADGGVPLAEGPGYRISRGTPHTLPPSIEGPGYRIIRDEPASPEHQAARSAEAIATEKRSDPIICQGERLMRIDGESIESTGDAVIAENGCDLYISNANIRAGGVGIIARQARVHIVNSTIGGSHGSYEASQGAEIYVASSTFAGIGRRFDTAQMTDLGGNQYQLHRQ